MLGVTPPDTIALIYFALLNSATLAAFGYDKRQSRRAGARTSELTLVLLGALGGWPCGLVAMRIFRHKSIKWTFLVKFALGLIPFAAEIWLWLHWR